MCYNQRWFIQLGDDIRHREGLAGTGDTEKRLALVSFLKAFY